MTITTTSTTKHESRETLILATGAGSGVLCFFLFQAAYWLTTQLAQYLPASEGGLLSAQAEPGKWIGAAFVLLIAFAATYAWDKIRVKRHLSLRQYWTMIGLALAVCLLTALFWSGF